MERPFTIDLEQEKVLFENEWFTTQQLSQKIRRMIDNQDFRIGTAGAALEYLQVSLRQARTYTVRLLGEDAQALEQHAALAGISPAAFLRQSLQAYLATLPPLPQAAAAPVASAQAEAAPPFELKAKKSEGSAKVMVDPSLTTEPVIESEWFKKNR